MPGLFRSLEPKPIQTDPAPPTSISGNRQEMIIEAKAIGIEIRVGINTGMCTVGNFGSEDRMDYSIIGKEVNVTSRLESNSSPGIILISESTYELIKDHYKCEPEGDIEAKGIDRKINTFSLV